MFYEQKSDTESKGLFDLQSYADDLVVLREPEKQHQENMNTIIDGSKQ